MKKTNGRLTDRQIENLMIGMWKEGSALDTYRSGFQEAAAAVLCINGGDRETLKRAARLLMNVSSRISQINEKNVPKSTVPEDYVTGGTWKEVGRKD